jgi:hypothetical protein
MSLQEQIEKRIANFEETAEAFKTGGTNWHKTQISVLKTKVDQLKWVLELIAPPEGKLSGIALAESGVEQKFLEGWLTFQKDKNGIYFYTSENGLHSINLAAILEDFKQHLTEK